MAQADDKPSPYALDKLIGEARRLAAEFRRTTGKSLGLTSEIACNDAARLLGLELLPAQAVSGYDAVGRGRWEGQRVQIKGRAIFDEHKGGQRVGQLKAGLNWDLVVLVLMDEDYEPFEIWQADRETLREVLEGNGARRSRKGALSVAKFKAIGERVWTRENGLEDDGYWTNA